MTLFELTIRQKMKEKVKELLQPKKDNLVNYLDEKIKEIPTRTGLIMCGRFAVKAPSPKLAKQFHTDLFESFEPHYNIAPTAGIPVVIIDPYK